MEYVIHNADPYSFDLDGNGMPAVSRKNIALVNALALFDPGYRASVDVNNEKSSARLIREAYENDPDFLSENDTVLEIVKRIDKENSTHLSVSGGGKGGETQAAQGRDLTAKKICCLPNLLCRLRQGDTELVKEIAGAVDGRNNFSFATKFCAFVSRALFEGEEADRYCIYDKVVSDVLPYYAYIYLGETKYKKRKTSAIEDLFKEEKDYAGYKGLIDRIREAAKEKTAVSITRRDFDLLLWFWFRRDENRVKAALSLIPQN